MRVIRLYEKNTDERLLDEIANALKDGKIIIYPTDSVYAMGCDALNVRAVEKICEIKDYCRTDQQMIYISYSRSTAEGG